jgi:predicted Zn finger-like uncharacterized protein
MIITCPQCATRYEAPEASFQPNGRRVKCSSCSYIWFQTAPIAEPISIGQGGDMENMDIGAGSAHDIETEAARLTAASRRASARFATRKAMRIGNVRGWAVLAALLAVVCVVGFFGRVQVVKLLPAAASLYATVGLAVNVRGLEFESVRYQRAFENGVPILQVSGLIKNVSNERLLVPRVRFGLYDASRREVYHWTMAVGREPLEPDVGVNFATRLAAPPDAAREVQVRFVGDGN